MILFCTGVPKTAFALLVSLQVDPYALPGSGGVNLDTEDALHLTSVAVETTVDVVDENGVVGQATGIIIETYI